MKKTKLMVLNAVIAAVYTVLTLAFPLSFGAIQFRFSEALCLLAVFSGKVIPGLSVGCFLSNLLGFFLGLNPLGLVDSLVGTLATLIGCLMCFIIGKKTNKPLAASVLCPLPIALSNAVIISLELTLVLSPTSYELFFANALSVGLGELGVLYTLGLFILYIVYKNKKLKDFFIKL